MVVKKQEFTIFPSISTVLLKSVKENFHDTHPNIDPFCFGGPLCHSDHLRFIGCSGSNQPVKAVVQQSPVSFTSAGEKIVGRLYVPEGVSTKHPAPGLVITGAWMTVKEQMPHRYAERWLSVVLSH
jgi:hypothetical protein